MEAPKFSNPHSVERHQSLPPLAIETGELLDSCKSLFSFTAAVTPGNQVAQVQERIDKLTEQAEKIHQASDDEMPSGKEYAMDELTKMIGRLEELIKNINRAEINNLEASLTKSEQTTVSAEVSTWLAEVEELTEPVLEKAPKALTTVELSKLDSAERSAYFEERTSAIADAIAEHSVVVPGTTEPKDNSKHALVEALSFLMHQEEKKMTELAGGDYDFSRELGTDRAGLQALLYKLRYGHDPY